MPEIQNTKRLWMIVLTLAALIVAFAPQAAAGEKLVVQMSEPFEIAGTVYPSGELSIREVHDLSPVTQLHEIRVNGESLGLMQAEIGEQSLAKRDVMTFKRSDEGHLVLVSVALQGQRAHTYKESSN